MKSVPVVQKFTAELVEDPKLMIEIRLPERVKYKIRKMSHVTIFMFDVFF